MAKRRYPKDQTRKIRRLQDAIIDEAGLRWDEVYDAGEPLVEGAGRFLLLDSFSAPTEVPRATFERAATAENGEPGIIEFRRPGQYIVAIETSDCLLD